MNKDNKNLLDTTEVIFEECFNIITNHTGDKNLQFKTLMSSLADKLNWSNKEINENINLIRWYIHSHNDFTSIRGKHGGIMRNSDLKKKNELKQNKENLKQDIKSSIETKLSSSNKENDLNDNFDENDSNDDEMNGGF